MRSWPKSQGVDRDLQRRPPGQCPALFGRIPVNRRSFLTNGVVISAAVAWPRATLAQQSAESAPMPGWRGFEVTSRIEILKPEAGAQAWLPLPSVEAPAGVRNEGNTCAGKAG